MLPRDPFVLLSFINTKLRDEYGSFDILCDILSADKDMLTAKLADIGYTYDEKLNKFV